MGFDSSLTTECVLKSITEFTASCAWGWLSAHLSQQQLELQLSGCCRQTKHWQRISWGIVFSFKLHRLTLSTDKLITAIIEIKSLSIIQSWLFQANVKIKISYVSKAKCEWLYLAVVFLGAVLCSSACRGVQGFASPQMCAHLGCVQELGCVGRAPPEHRAAPSRGMESARSGKAPEHRFILHRNQ